MRKSPNKFALLLIAVSSMFLMISCQKDEIILNEETPGLKSDLIQQSQVVTYWEQSFTREEGKPITIKIKIGSEDLQHFEDCFVLQIKNGNEDGTKRISSAIIKVDGKEIFGPKDFSLEVDFLEKEICGLTETSEIVVELRSEVGSFIDVWLEGTLKPNHALITPDGGTYSFLNHSVNLTFPENAIDKSVIISIENTKNLLPEGYKSAFITSYEFLPDGLEFQAPVSGQIKFDDEFQVENSPQLLLFDKMTGYALEIYNTEFNHNNQTLNFVLSHFSEYVTSIGTKLQKGTQYSYKMNDTPNSYSDSEEKRIQINQDSYRAFKKWQAYSKKIGITFYETYTNPDIEIEFLTLQEGKEKFSNPIINLFANPGFAGTVFYKYDGHTITKRYIILNDAKYFVASDYFSSKLPEKSKYSVEGVLVHEIGHLFGLGEEYCTLPDISAWACGSFLNQFRSVMGDEYPSFLPLSICQYDLDNLKSKYNITSFDYKSAYEILPTTPTDLSFNISKTISNPIQVKVTDIDGRGVPNVTVSFFTNSQNIGTYFPFVDITDNNGIAQIDSWKLPSESGSYEIIAKAWLELAKVNEPYAEGVKWASLDKSTSSVKFTVIVNESGQQLAYFPFNGNKNDESGNGNAWKFFGYSSGMYGPVTEPVVNNGRIYITTHDQMSTFLNTGLALWKDYTLELDAKIEQPLDGAYRGIYIWFYANNVHYNPANNQPSLDGYMLNMKGRDNTWTLYRQFQQESGKNGIVYSSGSKTLTIGQEYHIKIVVQGTNIKIYFNSKGSPETLLTEVNVTSDILTGGTIGLGGSDDIVSYDNVTVTKN